MRSGRSQGLKWTSLILQKRKKALQIVCFPVSIKWNWMINISVLVELTVLSAEIKTKKQQKKGTVGIEAASVCWAAVVAGCTSSHDELRLFEEVAAQFLAKADFKTDRLAVTPAGGAQTSQTRAKIPRLNFACAFYIYRDIFLHWIHSGETSRMWFIILTQWAIHSRKSGGRGELVWHCKGGKAMDHQQ